MGLLTTYSAANRVVDTALQVNYSRRIVFGSWTYVSLNVTTTYNQAWEYTRTAVKTFRYVGMDRATAEDCAADLRALFTRSTKTTVWNGSTGAFDTGDAGDILMADVVCQHEDGGMWSVTVSVNEQDTRQSLLSNLSPSSLFAMEDARAYDLDEGGSD